MQNPSSDESLEVITTLAPVETRLAENPPSPRPQINAEPGKETLARRRDLTAFIGEYDVPHGHKCIGDSDSYLASQVIVATSGKTECIVVCRPRPMAQRHINRNQFGTDRTVRARQLRTSRQECAVTGGTHHGNGGGNLQERRTRQLRVGGGQGRVSRAWPGTSSQHGRRREFR